jgi:RNA polymerase sigma-70 factor (ECF subfamily)
MDDADQHQPATFERLLEPHLDSLYRLAFRLAGQRSDAEDLFQDVLTRMYQRLEELAVLDDAGPWLRRVMYNHFIDDRRRYGRERLVVVPQTQLPGESVESHPGGPLPEKLAERADDLIQLDAALQQLSEAHRHCLLLHDVEGYKLKEIQSITGDPVGTIKSRLHRARAHLRGILARDATFS